ncbi:alpha-L-fucosidase, partial [bacterium]
MGFEPSVESLREHTVPQWFHDAKFGIFIHWTMASIPAFAPQAGSLIDVVREHPADFLKYNPYAEWYWNAMKIPGSETALHHAEVYGDAPFEAFREPFEASIEAWNPEPLLDLIVAAGARYVVLVTKHHDGFALWPTGIENPHMPGWHTRRDVVGELARGIRERGLRFGVYYSGGLDWTFEPRPMLGVADLFASVPARDEYRQYADAHFRELIERYEPDVLWNDIAYPAGPGLL